MKQVLVLLFILGIVDLAVCKGSKKHRGALNLKIQSHENEVEDVNISSKSENPNRGRRGIKHFVTVVKPTKHLKKVKIIQAKIHYKPEETEEEDKVHHSFEESHEHIEHEGKYKKQLDLYQLPVEKPSEEIQYTEANEEHIKVKHHHHHHHHNHVKTIVKKEPYPIEKIVHIPIEKIIHVPKPYPLEKIVEKVVNVPVEKIVHVPKPYPVEKIVEIPVQVKKKVEVPYPVEKLVYIPKPYPVEKIIEKIIHIPKPYPVEKIVKKIVHVPRPYPVYKAVPYPIEVKVPAHIEKSVEKQIHIPHKGIIENHEKAVKRDSVNTQQPYYYEPPKHEYQEIKNEENSGQHDQSGLPSREDLKYSAASQSSNIRTKLFQQQIESIADHWQQQQELEEIQSRHNAISIGNINQNEHFRISVENNEPQPYESAPVLTQTQLHTMTLPYIFLN